MLIFIRLSFVVCALFFSGHAYAAAEVPVTVPHDDTADSLGFTYDDERKTCDPEFWTVLNNRAKLTAQREVSQNKNLIAKSDSVLSISCFDEYLEHLNDYAEDNFPVDPSNDAGSGAQFTAIVSSDRGTSSANPSNTDGYNLFAILEILVLDQLTSVSGLAGGGNYIEKNFPDLMLGGRHIDASPWDEEKSWDPDAGDNDSVGSDSFGGCGRMNKVWKRSQCYDFATESSLSEYQGSADDHDGFYMFAGYKQREDDSKNVRTLHVGSDDYCDSPSHPSWADGLDNAFPEAGAAGGVDSYEMFLNLFDTSSCADPIKIGYIVKDREGVEKYEDAVCPTPGCWFNPPASLTGTGTCSN